MTEGTGWHKKLLRHVTRKQVPVTRNGTSHFGCSQHNLMQCVKSLVGPAPLNSPACIPALNVRLVRTRPALHVQWCSVDGMIGNAEINKKMGKLSLRYHYLIVISFKKMSSKTIYFYTSFKKMLSKTVYFYNFQVPF